MSKIDNHVSFVKEQVGVQEKLAKKYADEPYRKSVHLKSASSFADLARFLEEIQRKGTEDTSYLNRGDSPQKKILLTYEDLEGAPDELLKELNITDTDKQELIIEYMIAEVGGVLSLDKIMVELFRRTKEIPRRNTITSRLYRMVAKGMIYNVPGKKGVYSTYELSEADAKKMFGQLEGDTTEETPSLPPVQESKPISKPEQTPASAVRVGLMGSAAAPRRPQIPGLIRR